MQSRRLTPRRRRRAAKSPTQVSRKAEVLWFAGGLMRRMVPACVPCRRVSSASHHAAFFRVAELTKAFALNPLAAAAPALTLPPPPEVESEDEQEKEIVKNSVFCALAPGGCVSVVCRPSSSLQVPSAAHCSPPRLDVARVPQPRSSRSNPRRQMLTHSSACSPCREKPSPKRSECR